MSLPTSSKERLAKTSCASASKRRIGYEEEREQMLRGRTKKVEAGENVLKRGVQSEEGREGG